MTRAASAVRLDNPFPGLRPFEREHSYLFFGREEQTDELLRRLARSRFLAVVGTSGSGKSSLVRAGLLPFLDRGYMVQAGSHWRTALLRPGGSPVDSLAQALDQPETLGASPDRVATLQRSSLGLVETVRDGGMDSMENLLVIVDQFEELFRFRQQAPEKEAHEEAADFVRLLLTAAEQQEVPIYVVLTMRSDFLGDCAQFRNLPEALNDGQYLIPRMTREQKRQAIEGPLKVAGASITPRLVQRLLNDVGDEADQLPILQHALMRTWEVSQEHRQEGKPVDLQHYQCEKIQGMANALSLHADEAYEELPSDDSRRIARKLFRCLAERRSENREVRRPTRLKTICRVVGEDQALVVAVIDAFRSHGRTFLTPPENEELKGESVIDISHESLIRQWDRLGAWVEEEAKSGEVYQRLANTSIRYSKRQASLYRPPELQEALDWRERDQWNPVWAERYHPRGDGGEESQQGFEYTIQFLEESRSTWEAEVAEKEKQQKEKLESAQALARAQQEKAVTEARSAKRLRRMLMVLGVVSLLVLAAGVLAFLQWRRAEDNEQVAKSNAEAAEVLRQEAEVARSRAQAAEKEAEASRAQTEAVLADMKGERENAEKLRLEAERYREQAQGYQQEATTRQTAVVKSEDQSVLAIRRAEQKLNAAESRAQRAERDRDLLAKKLSALDTRYQKTREQLEQFLKRPPREEPRLPSAPEGTVFDPQTGLLWTREDNGGDINWRDANRYCRNLRLAGFSDWRLPTIDELKALYDPGSSRPHKIRRNFELTGGIVWSSKMEGSGSAWFQHFGDGTHLFAAREGSEDCRALCLRSAAESGK